MNLKPGYAYFLKDEFFTFVNDPYINQDHEKNADGSLSRRPHFFAFQDAKTTLYWLVPISSQVDKYRGIIQKRSALNKPTDGIRIEKVHEKDRAFLFQDMFPITDKYIAEPYMRNGDYVYIKSQATVASLEKTARKVSNLLLRGIKFTPTQPDIPRIQKLMLAEMHQQQTQETPTKAPMADRIAAATEEAAQRNSDQQKKPPTPDLEM